MPAVFTILDRIPDFVICQEDGQQVLVPRSVFLAEVGAVEPEPGIPSNALIDPTDGEGVIDPTSGDYIVEP